MQINTTSDALDNLNKKLGGADIEIEPSTNKVDALKKIYKTLGGTDDVAGLSTVYQVLEKITEVAEGGGGERALNPVNITWVDLPETFDDYNTIFASINIKTADGYEMGDIDNTSLVIQWDDEWGYAPKIIAYSSKAEIGEYAVVMPQNYLPNYKIVVKSGDADDSNSVWVEVYGDCTLSIEAVE